MTHTSRPHTCLSKLQTSALLSGACMQLAASQAALAYAAAAKSAALGTRACGAMQPPASGGGVVHGTVLAGLREEAQRLAAQVTAQGHFQASASALGDLIMPMSL